MSFSSKEKSLSEIQAHKNSTISTLVSYINKNIASNPSKADKFIYWLDDYVKFLEFEEHFNPKSLRRYKRGEIIKAHLGYNIGNEEGGLHYCVVIDNKNQLSSGIITVVPLTSLKPGKDINNLRNGEVFLGDDLRVKILQKCNSHANEILAELQRMTFDTSEASIAQATEQLHNLQQKRLITNKIAHEFDKMKSGSIALVSQVTTISKIRIYDPKTNDDVFSNIKLSNENLDKIDEMLTQLFVKSTKNCDN